MLKQTAAKAQPVQHAQKVTAPSLRRGALILAGSNVAGQILLFIYRIGLSRMLGPEGMGLFGLIFPYYSIIYSITISGLCVAVSRTSGEYAALDKMPVVRHFVSTARRFFLIAFAPVAVFTVIFFRSIAADFLGDQRMTAAVLLTLPLIFLTGIENIHKNFFYGTNRVEIPALSEILEQIVRMAAVLGLLAFLKPQDGRTAVSLIVTGMVICEIVSAAFLSFCYIRRIRGVDRLDHDQRQRGQIRRKLFHIAVPISMSAILANILGSFNTVIIPKRLIASGMLPSDALAAFGTLNSMAMSLLTFPGALMSGLYLLIVPSLSGSMARGDLGGMRSRAGKTISVTMGVIIPAVCVIVPLGEQLCQMLYSRSGIGGYLPPLAAGVVLGSLQGILASLLNGIGKQKVAAATGAFSGLVQLAVTYFLAARPGVGMGGVIAGIAFSNIVGAALNLWAVRVYAGLDLRWWPWFVRPLISGVAAALWTNIVFRILGHMEPITAVTLAAACGAAVYLLIWRLTGGRGLLSDGKTQAKSV